MRAIMVTVASGVLTTAVLVNAFYQKQQFYPSVVYLTKSNPSMAVLYVQAFVFVLLAGKLMRKIFFGQLRAAEMEHLIERSWYAVTETCLAFTVFRDDLSPKFVALFTLLLFLKCFHWLAEDRVDFMERSPNISLGFHIRVISLLALLSALDAVNVHLAYQSTLTKGASVQLVFGFEYAILFTMALNVFVKYALHLLDLQRENPWEEKAVYLLYTELVMGFIKVILYLSFISIMMKIHTFPLFAIRPMYLSMRSFKKALNDVVQSRRAIRNMNTLYPDATALDLETASDNICIICREEMIGGNGSAKKLPCGHIFHVSCLRNWFQRQQTCPTCRMDVLRMPATTPAAAAANAAQPGAANAGAQAAPIPAANVMQFQQALFAQFMGMQQQQRLLNNNNQPANNNNQVPPPNANAQPGAAAPTPNAQGAPPPFIPPFAFPLGMMMAAPPMPIPPANLSQLSIEQLRAMEGRERASVEARIRCLQDIRTLLDAASAQMQQYQSVAGTPATPATSNTTTPPVPPRRFSSADPPRSTSSDQASSSRPVRPTAASTVDGSPQPPPPTTEEEKAMESVRQRRLERFSQTLPPIGIEGRLEERPAEEEEQGAEAAAASVPTATTRKED